VRVQRIFPVGKELFIIFDNTDTALRLHFGMSGSERVVKLTGESDLSTLSRHSNPRKKYAGSILFQDLALSLFDSTIASRTLSQIASVENRLTRDVMSTRFSVEAVVEILRNDSRAIMDSTMDQVTLPGVGNVIKCEAIFLTKIHPNTPTQDIAGTTLKILVSNLRKVAQTWYYCTKKSRDLNKRVYGKPFCGDCQGSINLVRDGDFHRITYYCSRCQPILPHNTRRDNNENVHALQQSSVNHTDGRHAMPDPQEALLEVLKQQMCRCKRLATLQRVRKEGSNIGRLFWSCPVRQTTFRQPLESRSSKNCGFFQWADTLFPRCAHNQVAILRRVLKTGPNNGRYFFCCGRLRVKKDSSHTNDAATCVKESSGQCDFFLWADAVKRPRNGSTTSVDANTPTKNISTAIVDVVSDTGRGKRSADTPADSDRGDADDVSTRTITLPTMKKCRPSFTVPL
jgi:formamidopyrimidine-DNA glycosylase